MAKLVETTEASINIPGDLATGLDSAVVIERTHEQGGADARIVVTLKAGVIG